MKTRMLKKRILIVDEDHDEFYKALQADDLFRTLGLKIVSKAHQAIKEIQENANKFYAVFLSPDVDPPGSLAIIKTSVRHQPIVPIFYIETMNTSLEPSVDDQQLCLAGSIAKPFEAKDIINKVSDQIGFFDSERALKLADTNDDKLDEESQEDDDSFMAISLQHYVSGSKSLFDIYVKMREDKYIKILQAGDQFDSSRVQQYLDKNVRYLYIRKEAQSDYVKYCDRLNRAILKNPQIDLKKKFGQLFNQAEVTLTQMKTLGVNNESIVYAQKYIKNTTLLLNKVAHKDKIIKDLMSNLKNFEHSTSVLVIASMLVDALGFKKEASHEILGMACMMHDIAFHNQDNEELDYNSLGKHDYTREEDLLARLNSRKCFGREAAKLKKIYQEHPQKACDILSRSDYVTQVVLQIIRQHHSVQEKAEGCFSGGIVHPLATVLEISDEIIHYLATQATGDAKKVKKDFTQIAQKYPQNIGRTFLKLMKIKL